MGKLFFTVFAFERDVIARFRTAKLEETGSAWLIQLLSGRPAHCRCALADWGAIYPHFIVVDTVNRGLRRIQCQLIT